MLFIRRLLLLFFFASIAPALGCSGGSARSGGPDGLDHTAEIKACDASARGRLSQYQPKIEALKESAQKAEGDEPRVLREKVKSLQRLYKDVGEELGRLVNITHRNQLDRLEDDIKKLFQRMDEILAEK